MATLNNFTITSPQNQDILIYSNGSWINSNINGFFGILDGRYSANTHNHDGRYILKADAYTKSQTYPAASLYTKAEIDAMFSGFDPGSGGGGGSGLVNSASNVGSGAGVFHANASGDLQFRSLFSQDIDLLTIAVSGTSVIFTPKVPTWSKLVSANGQLNTSHVNFANQGLNTSSQPSFAGLTVNTGSWSSSGLKLTGAAPSIYFSQDDSTNAFLGINGDTFYLLPDTDSNGSFESPYTLVVGITSNSFTYKGNAIYHAGNKPTLGELGAAAASHNHSADNITSGTLNSARLPTITYSMVNFANQNLLTNSSPNFAGLTVSNNEALHEGNLDFKVPTLSYRTSSTDLSNYSTKASGFNTTSVGQDIGLSNGWHHVIHLHHNDNNGYAGQIAMTFGSVPDLMFRGANSSGFGAWRTVWTDANDGPGSGLNADLLDGLHASNMLRSDSSDTFNGGTLTIVNASTQKFESTGTIQGLEVLQSNEDSDALMMFHIAGGYAAYFGLDRSTNDFAVGGYSMGTSSRYRVWHEGNHGAGSGLNADLLDGYHESTFARKPGDHTTNNTEYSMVWENNGGVLYTSSAHLKYNPGLRRLTSGRLLLTGSDGDLVTLDSTGHANLVIDRASTEYDNNILFKTGGTLRWRLWMGGDDSIIAFRNEGANKNILEMTSSGCQTYDDFTFLSKNTGIYFNPTDMNDAGGIRFTGSNPNDGALEFWTTDDYSEPFVFRMYDTGSSGAYREPLRVHSTLIQANSEVILTHNNGLVIRTSTNGAGAKITFSDNASSGYAQRGFLIYKHSNDAFGISSGDAFELSGTESDTKFIVRGEGWADDWVATSDIRVKENLEKIDSSLDKVAKLAGYTYDQINLKQRKAGLIAQDVKEVLPEAVGEDGEGMLNVSPMAVLALLVNAVNDLAKEVKELKNGN